MANQIILKRSSQPSKIPTTAQMELGEVAINTYDGRVFIKKDDGTPSVVEIGGVTARSVISAGVGISYNSTSGVVSTAQNLSTVGTPTFNGMILTGNLVPDAANSYSLGTLEKPFQHMYVGPSSLYVNGKQVITDSSGTMTFSSDIDQNIRLTTTGLGVLQLGSSTTNVTMDGTLQISAGKNITSSDGIKVGFGDNIEMNSNKVIGLGAPSAATDAATKGYVDTAIGAISTSAITQGNSSVQVVDSGTGTVTVTVDGTTALTVDATGVIVQGGLIVNGTTTTVNSAQLAIADNIITLNSDVTGAPTQNAGVEVERGDENNVSVRWNEGLAKWQFTNDGATYLPLAASTTDLVEGTNQYHTTARARSSVSGNTSSGVSYTSATGVFALAAIPNSSLSSSAVIVGTTSIDLGAGATTLAGLDSVTSTSFTGALTGNASTATSAGKWTTARTITLAGDLTGNVSIDGSGNATLTATVAANSVALGTDTTGNYMSGVTAGAGISVTHTAGEGSTATIASTITQYTDALAVSANTSAIATAKSEAISSAATDATTKANAAQAAAISSAATDATTKANAAQAAAISSAATDATTKANAAQAAAISSAATDATTKANAAQAAAISSAATDATTKANAAQAAAAVATNLTSGTVPNARISGAYTGLTNLTGSGTVDFSKFYGNAADTAALPSFSWTTDTNTGIWAPDVDKVGITTGGVNRVTISSTGIMTTGEVTAYASDARLKTNVVAIDGALDKVEAIRGVTYDWNEKGQELGLGTEHQVGVIAQEIEAVLPQLVVDSAHEGFKTVKYDKLTALLIEAVKELSAKVKTLEARLGN